MEYQEEEEENKTQKDQISEYSQSNNIQQDLNRQDSSNIADEHSPNNQQISPIKQMDIHQKDHHLSEQLQQKTQKSLEQTQTNNQQIQSDSKVQMKNHKIRNILGKVQQLISYKDQFLQNHLKNCKNIISQINTKTALSDQYLHQISKFFEYQSELLKKNAKSLMSTDQPKLQGVYYDKNSKYKVIPQLCDALSLVDQLQAEQSNKMVKFSEFINKSILKDILYEQSKQIEKEQKKFKEQIGQYVSELDKHKENFNKSNLKLMKIANIKVNPNSDEQKKDQDPKYRKDSHSKHMKFQSYLIDIVNTHKLLGKCIVDYWEKIQVHESQKIKLIQESFSNFFSMYKEVYGNNEFQGKILDQFNQINPLVEGKKAFNQDNLLHIETVKQIKIENKMQENEQLSFEIIKFYLYQFKVPDTLLQQNCLPELVVREFEVQKDIGKVMADWKDIKIQITIDDFLIYQEQKEQVFNKEIVEQNNQNITICKNHTTKFKKMNCNFLKIVERKKDPYGLQYKMQETKKGIIFDSVEKQLIKFKNKSDLQEFLEYMQGKFGNEIVQKE